VVKAATSGSRSPPARGRLVVCSKLSGRLALRKDRWPIPAAPRGRCPVSGVASQSPVPCVAAPPLRCIPVARASCPWDSGVLCVAAPPLRCIGVGGWVSLGEGGDRRAVRRQGASSRGRSADVRPRIPLPSSFPIPSARGGAPDRSLIDSAGGSPDALTVSLARREPHDDARSIVPARSSPRSRPGSRVRRLGCGVGPVGSDRA